MSLDIPAPMVLACMPSDITEKVVLGSVVAKKSDWVPFGIPISVGDFCDCVILGSPNWLCSHISARGAVVRVCVMGGHVVDEMNLRTWPPSDVSSTVG